MVRVSGDSALSEFRERLTGRYGLDLVRQYGGAVLVQHPVGVGKSVWLDAITLCFRLQILDGRPHATGMHRSAFGVRK